MKTTEEKKQKKQEIHRHLYDLSIVKAELDEILHRYLISTEKYTETQTFINIQMCIGIIASCFTAVVALLVYKKQLESQRALIAVLVLLFWALIYTEALLKKFFFYQTFSGCNTKNEQIQVLTKVSDTTPLYTILIYSGKKKIPSKVTVDVRSIYMENFLITDKFKEVIRNCLYDST